MNLKTTFKNKSLPLFLAIGICLAFFIAYCILGITRHEHFESYGFDLGITDQIVWEYSRLKPPITTVHYYPYYSILTDHLEFIYAPLSIIYWLWSDTKFLIISQSFFICLSGLAVFLLARRKKIPFLLALFLEFSYLAFYGIQNALWFDVHSLVFGASFLPWLIYFLDKGQSKLSWLFLILTLISKENLSFFCLFNLFPLPDSQRLPVSRQPRTIGEFKPFLLF